MSFDYDLIVIGSGPAGEACAMNAAKKGKRVAVIELPAQIGGNCTHKGTIPSKALRQAVKQIIQFNNNPMFRSIAGPRTFSFPRILEHALKVIDDQVKLRSQFYGRNRVDVHTGHGRIVDEHTVEIIGSHEVKDKITTDKIVIATGSRPYQPASVNFKHPRVYDSDLILEMSETPRTIVIYGAGVIGCEYASIFCGLGIKVDLINPGDRLLSFLDDEISDALSYHLRSNGVLIRHKEEFASLETADDRVVVHLQSGKRIKADAFMWCNGRSGNTENLGLENVGLQPNKRGQLEVNEEYQTAVPSISAIGDVIGWPSLASAAYDQGRSAAAAIIDSGEFWHVDEVPNGIYTIPEISSIGKTERELTEAKVPYEVGQAMFKNTARAQITNEKVGMLKLLFHRETFELLGIHCFGAQAAEIVHIGQAIMKQKGEGNTIEYFTKTTFNYPTMAEAYRVAAINGLNRVF